MCHVDLKVEGSSKHLVMQFSRVWSRGIQCNGNAVQHGEKRKTQSRVNRRINHRNDSMGFPMP